MRGARGIVRAVNRPLEPAPEPGDDAFEPFDDDEDEGLLRRPAWWRWVAIVVVVALVVATPFAYALYLLLT